MPFNPCGRVVDFARRPYRTACRFFRDNELIEVPIQFYRAAPGAPSLGRSTSFMSLDWTSSTETREAPNYADQPWLQRPGEVFGDPRPYSPWPVPIGLDYSHVCGTDAEFIEGAEYDPDREVEYDEQGLPLCCRGPMVPMFPLVLGFEAEIEGTPLPPLDHCQFPPDLLRDQWYEFTIPAGSIQTFWFNFPGFGTGTAYNWRFEFEWVSGAPYSGLFSARCYAGCSTFLFTFDSAIQTGNWDVASITAFGGPLDLITFQPSGAAPHDAVIRVRHTGNHLP